ncbi:unnamed protein product [Lepeophtheirus salmonis]|uniref:(salmon louse) hypothetical protein n=1 Tax=Lepeophtheirus salmonis TaxID=72036 RepID=A0A7R8H721_LEPSM|nr:unnamed protein product [Lepeophtheirus salmonis]CAF2893741.1 unnamed protein product [Lepeophtheirus salmonis]
MDKTFIVLTVLSLIIHAYFSEGQSDPFNRRSPYNCTINRIIQGQWVEVPVWRVKPIMLEVMTSSLPLIFRMLHLVFIVSDFLSVLPTFWKKRETGCVSLETGDKTIIKKKTYTPVNCRSSIEGVFQFTYQLRWAFTGDCSHNEQQIHSCQNVGSQFLISNQKFNVTYRKCEGMDWTSNSVVEFACLESRRDEKFRCFLKNRDDDYYLGMSITPECNTIKTIERAPVRLKLTPVRSQLVEPTCHLPENFTGEWINTANVDADVIINSTHIIERWHPDDSRYRKVIYVCKEQRDDSRYMMGRLTIDGCQIDYQCIDFVPRHHNIIRFRMGEAGIKNDFHTICSWVKFKTEAEWKYNLMLKKDPVPIRCPVAGAFNFTQTGDFLFETRFIGGITKAPRPDVWNRPGQFSCKQNISRLTVCDTDHKEISIDETYCWSTDHLGRPIDIYSVPDYRLQCIGYWKENLKSYLITYDQLDAFTNYRCWVYQRADLNKMLMSMSVGPYCDLGQDVDSKDWRNGAAVSLVMDENEREFDRCPMYFNDGSEPWTVEENYVRVFNFDDTGKGPEFSISPQ